MKDHDVVDATAWLRARKALLDKEKEFTCARDALTLARRALPWERVDKRYVFDGPDGRRDAGQPLRRSHRSSSSTTSCSVRTRTSAARAARSGPTTSIATSCISRRATSRSSRSRAHPWTKLSAFKQRFGWTLQMGLVAAGAISTSTTTCRSIRRADREPGPQLRAEDRTPTRSTPGVSVFYRDEAGDIFHTYSTYARGLDMLNAGYHYLDLVPKGRDEDALPYTVAWLRHRDQYDAR